MSQLRRNASLFTFAAALAALGLVACAAPADEEAGEAQGAASTSGGARSIEDAGPPERVELGKYVNPSKGILLVKGRASEDNVLADERGRAIAYGTLGEDGRTLSTPEGDVCGGYTLSQVPGRLTVDVIWQAEGSVARDPEIAKGCRQPEGTYEMTEPGE